MKCTYILQLEYVFFIPIAFALMFVYWQYLAYVCICISLLQIEIHFYDVNHTVDRITKLSHIFLFYFILFRNRDRSVCIAIKLRRGLSRGRSSSPGRVKNFLFSTSYRPVIGPTHTPLRWVPRVKRPGRETDQSPPSIAKVDNAWICISTVPYIFIMWCLIKYTENFTFSFFIFRLLDNTVSISRLYSAEW
jgi:hypothetical protein